MWLIAAIVFAIVGVLNVSQRAVHQLPPTDGVLWAFHNNQIIADKIQPNSSAARAGMLAGDRLVAVSLDDKRFEEIASTADVQIYLDGAGANNSVTYLFQRPNYAAGNNFYYADLRHLDAPPRWTASALSEILVGLIFLFAGFFVLFNQGGRAPFVLHFAAVCLLAFVFLAFKPIGTFQDFDAAVAIFDDAAFLFFAPALLHFCLIYPVRRQFSKRIWKTLWLYVPAIVLAVDNTANYLVPLSPAQTQTLEKIDFDAWLYRAILWHFVAFLGASAGVLIYRYARNRQVIVRQRLKWMIAGMTAAFVPVVLYQIVKPIFTLPTENWLTTLAILPLALIPLTFGHSVVRYRLMDVDIVVRRAAVYALTTLAICMLIGVVAFGFVFLAFPDVSNYFSQSGLQPTEFAARVVIAVVAMAAIVMLSAPLKEFLQERADRFFYGERYDMRRGLLDFGKTLSVTTQIDQLLNALTSRLQQVLSVEKVAVLIEDGDDYRLARAVNLSKDFRVPANFRQLVRTNAAQQSSVIRADEMEFTDAGNDFARHELHYFAPCIARGRMVAVIGLGRTTDGSLLSSEDLDILQTVSGYVAIAIENSLLYEEQQKRTEELAVLKEFNESIVESVNVALLAVDTNGEILRGNTTAEDLFGLSRDEIVGQAVETLFTSDFTETLRDILGARSWDLQEVRHAYKVAATVRDGQNFVLNLAVAPLRSSEGTRTGAILILEDVTSRVALESQLQQSEKLSSIGLLAAGVAHEVNTPLTGVSSYTQMLLGMIPETDPKHLLLQKVAKQTDRASNIVGNLLNFSRAGGSTEFAAINVNRIVEDTLQLLEIELRRSRVTVNKNFAQNLPDIRGNAGKLQQVFTNLILNARDAIVAENGEINIETAFDHDKATVCISDNGGGISPENLSKIYDPFFTTKEVGRGTGLGLAVSYGIIQEHNGQISVASAIGEGTKFTITLPAAQSTFKQMQTAAD